VTEEIVEQTISSNILATVATCLKSISSTF